MDNLAFIRIDHDIIYIGEFVEVPRGIRNKGKTSAKELLIFGCNRNNIPSSKLALVKPYLKYDSVFVDFRR